MAYNAEARSDFSTNMPNPIGSGKLMEMCAWSAGYFDAKRGMV